MGTGGIASDADDHTCEDGDIRVNYHPSSGKKPEVFGFEEFKKAPLANPLPEDPKPWAPFKTRADFEFAALVQDARMSKAQVNALIKLFHRCIKGGDDPFTISSHNEMRDTLVTASERLPKVCLLTFCMCFIFFNLHYPSLRRKLSLQPFKMNHMIWMSGCAQYGLGLKICCRTQISSNTFNGMPVKCQSLMENQPPGFNSMMSHGLETGSGKFRYVGPYVILYFVKI